ncbi:MULTISPECIES: HP0495 family protein [Nitrosomonas]|uniref:UPF0250 protein C8R14_102131 n=2 Tax=Nitrosomonas eutropha TaxID=916 RepID=A0ABX5M9Y2_9PROT|nr:MULTISPECIES: DUF493 domain-containing protein [Nitrosomonas]ABI59029.1 protein of unknown function DUF493 [Nitrosomonas eutropha C91]MXS80799.1 DUF493 domain-containing protein [Nitrosomonas sp. GH22]PXV84012.1 hypothetical protein C8R14_102131 [Nitrosomonas eutropha]SDW41160.1 hypothetical protein SAMN05216317_105129 [Nitrosomonas eutropha]SEI46846.1 hypothetical protein SAMN05216318_103128 [Nitrosomonas eutropha]
MTEESLIEYPCDFPIKIMGKAQQGFTQSMLAIVKTHAPDFDDTTLEVRTSKCGTYLSLTCTIRATSRTQLDSLYQTLHNHPMVTMLL